MPVERPSRPLDEMVWWRHGDFERCIVFHPAYDFRESHPGYGCGDVELHFYLRGQDGAVEFVVDTDWCLPSCRRYDGLGLVVSRPTAVDLGYHSPVPRFEGQDCYDHCRVLGGTCYYDGSGLAADPVFERLIAEGSAGVWRALEEYYRQVFGE